MRTLVTGATGVIGSRITESMRQAGHNVIAVGGSEASSSIDYLLDLSEGPTVDEFVQQFGVFDTVVHCAAIAHGQPTGERSVSEVNSSMVRNLVSAFGLCQPHWIFLSSISVFDTVVPNSSYKLSDTPDPKTEYARGKFNDEVFLREVCQNLDIVRLFPVYSRDVTTDIEKRVYIPGTRVKVSLSPPPDYRFCGLETAVDAVQSMVHEGKGTRLHHVGDPNLESQDALLRRFPGTSIVVPLWVLNYVIAVAEVFGSTFQNVVVNLNKLGFPADVELGTLVVSEIKADGSG